MHLTKSYYTIREVSAMLGVPAYTLRYWETVFPQLCPVRVNSHRKYTPEDIKLVASLKSLLKDKGMTLEGAKRELVKSYRKFPPRNAFVCKSPDDALKLLAEVKSRTDDGHAIARIEAVMGWIKEGSQR